MFQIVGKIRLGRGLNMVADIDDSIAKYYRALIPKYYTVNPPMYSAHITVVRTFKEIPNKLDKWFDFAGKEVKIQYIPGSKFDGMYWFLDAWSDDIIEIRRELGLMPYRYGYSCYHITIGNVK